MIPGTTLNDAVLGYIFYRAGNDPISEQTIAEEMKSYFERRKCERPVQQSLRDLEEHCGYITRIGENVCITPLGDMIARLHTYEDNLVAHAARNMRNSGKQA
jgi:hypothetical protein